MDRNHHGTLESNGAMKKNDWPRTLTSICPNGPRVDEPIGFFPKEITHHNHHLHGSDLETGDVRGAHSSSINGNQHFGSQSTTAAAANMMEKCTVACVDEESRPKSTIYFPPKQRAPNQTPQMVPVHGVHMNPAYPTQCSLETLNYFKNHQNNGDYNVGGNGGETEQDGVEYATEHQQRRQQSTITSPYTPDDGSIDKYNTTSAFGLDQSEQRMMRDRSPVFNDQYANGELQINTKNDGEKRSGEYYTHNGKRIRRKQRDQGDNVKRSEDVDGYRGNDELNAVLAFIEGNDAIAKAAPLREEQGKRSKKKSLSSADQGTAAAAVSTAVQKKKSPSPIPANIESEIETPVSSPHWVAHLDNFVALDAKGDPIGGDRSKKTALPSDLVSSSTIGRPAADKMDEKGKFTTVITGKKNKQQNRSSGARVITASKNKRAKTPPPSATPQPERQRRNSLNIDYPSFPDVQASIAAVNKDAPVSSISTRSLRVKTGEPASVDTTATAFPPLDNADSEFNNTSFSSSFDGDAAAAAASGKLSYAFVAAAVGQARSNDPPENETISKEKSASPSESASPPPAGRVSIQQSPSPPPSISPTKDESAVEIKPMDMRSSVEFPSLSSSSIPAVDLPAGNAIGEWTKPTPLVSMPFVKKQFANGDPAVALMSFTYTSPEDESNGAVGRSVEDEAIRIAAAAQWTENGKEILQMIFDSCANGFASSGTPIEECGEICGVSAPPVQFFGIPEPPSTGEELGLSFVYEDEMKKSEEDDTDAVIRRLVRSTSFQSTSDADFARDAAAADVAPGSFVVAPTCSDLEKHGRGDVPIKTDCSSSSQGVTRRPTKVLTVSNMDMSKMHMSQYLRQAWAEFTADGNYVYYNPKKE